MTLRVGVIGTGMIGQDHVRRITHVLSGAEVVAVTDVDPGRADEVASRLHGAATLESGQALVDSSSVDAVVVTSWGPSHEQYVLAAIDAEKPVFCEKPLATTREACRRIIDAEVALGRRLVQVGFMRRYDAAYRALKDTVDAGSIGAPLMFHSVHRNAGVPSFFTKDMAIIDTAVHDFDVARWLLDEELTAIRVVAAKPNRLSGDLQDPLLLVAESESGVVVDVETSVNIRYGYDIRAEVVGETGTASLADRALVDLRTNGAVTRRVPADWRERFSGAFDTELQEWIDVLVAGEALSGPSAWDGYAATVVCAAGVEALRGGQRVDITLGDKPELYLK